MSLEKQQGQPRLLILFGLPGAGKTFVGQVLQGEFGFFHYDTKVDFTAEQRAAIAENRPMTEAMRVDFFKNVHQSVRVLWGQHPKLSVDNAFINDRFRREFLVEFPDATFVLVQASQDHRVRRISEIRASNHMISPENALKMSQDFEQPSVPYLVLNNDSDDIGDTKTRINALLEQIDTEKNAQT